MNDLEHAIAAYRAELCASADVASPDLDELEDHLRSTVDDLRAAGLTSERAIAEALARLGRPAPIAREQARVRTAFGVVPDRWRAWIATALLAQRLVHWWAVLGPHPRLLVTGQLGVELLFGTALCVGLALRRPWARAGMLGYTAILLVAMSWSWPVTGMYSLAPGWQRDLAIVLLLVPWRRRELTVAGLGMAVLAANVYAGVLAGLMFEPITGNLMLAMTTLAFIAAVSRVRWAPIAAVASALAVAIATTYTFARWGYAPGSSFAESLYVFAPTTLLAALGALAAARWLRIARIA